MIPTEFLDHITSEDACSGELWKKDRKTSPQFSSENTSPAIKKHKAKVKNKENNLDEINPVSERCSMASLNKFGRTSLDKKPMLPPHRNALKEKANLNNTTYHEQHYNVRNSTSVHNLSMNTDNLRQASTCKNHHHKDKRYDFCHHSMNESFVIQPHCQAQVLQSHCNFHPSCCHKVGSIDTISQYCNPTLEDRLENTEKLIREMNAKFEDIASTKHSAKNEFNKLVQTLTMTSMLGELEGSNNDNR